MWLKSNSTNNRLVITTGRPVISTVRLVISTDRSTSGNNQPVISTDRNLPPKK